MRVRPDGLACTWQRADTTCVERGCKHTMDVSVRVCTSVDVREKLSSVMWRYARGC